MLARGLSFALLISLSCAGLAAADVPITECGAVVPPFETGVLQADVTCRTYCDTDPSIVDCNGDDELCPGAAGRCVADWITLGRGARLELNGHVIEIAYHSKGVLCGSVGERGRCTVAGPGDIRGGKGTAVESPSLDVELIDLGTDETDHAVTSGGKVSMTDVRLGGREDGVRAAKTVRATRVRVGPGGIWTEGDLIVDQVTLGDGAGGLIAAGTIRGRDVDTVGGKTIAGRDILLRRVRGVPTPAATTLVEIHAERRVHLFGSTVGAITSGKKPRLVRSTCTESTVAGSAASWGVCTND